MNELDEGLLAAITVYFADPATVQRFVEGIAGAIASIIEIEATNAAELLSIEVDTQILIDRWLRGVTGRVKGINGTTARHIEQIIIDGLNNDTPVETVAQEIIDKFTQFSVGRAMLIARTEVQGASNYAAWATYGQLAVPFKRWVAVLDDKTRDTHAEAHWQIQGIFDPFIIGAYEMMYPGDPAAPIREVANCRCTIVPEWNPERSIWRAEQVRAIWNRYLIRTAREESALFEAVRQQFDHQKDVVLSILGA